MQPYNAKHTVDMKRALIMIWGRKTRNGTVGLEKIAERMTTDSYIKIWRDHLFDTMEDLKVNASDIVFITGQ